MAGRLPVRANLVKLDRAALRLLAPALSAANDVAGAVADGGADVPGRAGAAGALGMVGAGIPCCDGKLGAAGGGE